LAARTTTQILVPRDATGILVVLKAGSPM